MKQHPVGLLLDLLKLHDRLWLGSGTIDGGDGLHLPRQLYLVPSPITVPGVVSTSTQAHGTAL